ncbi:MAG: hypothetical protein HY037_07030 [Nitrospirae bacterium]|nr:hypothetical protein [Candidatus Troglogloeales bacterium]
MEKKKKGIISKVGMWYLLILAIFAGYTNWLPQIRGDAPEAAVAVDVGTVTPEQLKEMGQKIIFGTDDPEGALRKGETPIGKGSCPLCHRFFMDQKADRCPNLIALPAEQVSSPDPEKLLQMTEEERSYKRPLTERYQSFKEKLSGGEPNSGIKPHATPGGQYLVESEYCPNCFVVAGFAIKGTNDMVSPMPIINKPPIELTDTEIVSVVTFLQTRSGDMSKGTAKESWEAYFGKKLGEAAPGAVAAGGAAPSADSKLALDTDTPDQIVGKMGCFACHKIPGIAVAKIGMVGPLLIEGTNAPNRIKSPEYRKAFKEGKVHATTPKEYVMESIMTPWLFIVPGFQDDMLKDFSKKFTFAALSNMADYLLQQTADKAIKEGLDRLPQEKEGPLKKTAMGNSDKQLAMNN